MKATEIIDQLSKHYGWDALQRRQVYSWIKEVKSGRNDFLNIPPRGRAPDEGLDECFGKAAKEDPHLSTREIARALNIGSTIVRNQLTKYLGMKCCHMRWVSHPLTGAHKGKHTEMAGSMLQMLESHAASNFHFLWIDDESCLFHDYHYETMWGGTSWEEVNKLERRIHYYRKTMVTAFLNETGEYFLNTVP
jgi:hypothetical protein